MIVNKILGRNEKVDVGMIEILIGVITGFHNFWF